jgi:hypothetical protein
MSSKRGSVVVITATVGTTVVLANIVGTVVASSSGDAVE